MMSANIVPQNMSCRLGHNACVSMLHTLSFVRSLTPRFPCKKLLNHVHHCTRIGLSRPSSFRFCAMIRAASLDVRYLAVESYVVRMPQKTRNDAMIKTGM